MCMEMTKLAARSQNNNDSTLFNTFAIRGVSFLQPIGCLLCDFATPRFFSHTKAKSQ